LSLEQSTGTGSPVLGFFESQVKPSVEEDVDVTLVAGISFPEFNVFTSDKTGILHSLVNIKE
jgi:hypothetical protein